MLIKGFVKYLENGKEYNFKIYYFKYNLGYYFKKIIYDEIEYT